MSPEPNASVEGSALGCLFAVYYRRGGPARAGKSFDLRAKKCTGEIDFHQNRRRLQAVRTAISQGDALLQTKWRFAKSRPCALQHTVGGRNINKKLLIPARCCCSWSRSAPEPSPQLAAYVVQPHEDLPHLPNTPRKHDPATHCQSLSTRPFRPCPILLPPPKYVQALWRRRPHGHGCYAGPRSVANQRQAYALQPDPRARL
jgi:hypothetical protein